MDFVSRSSRTLKGIPAVWPKGRAPDLAQNPPSLWVSDRRPPTLSTGLAEGPASPGAGLRVDDGADRETELTPFSSKVL